ncbi:MAG: hypothetical protein AAGJ32_00810 [Pseudomonadota bacterium]
MAAPPNPLKHYDLKTDGRIVGESEHATIPEGPATMTAKIWASGPEQVADVVVALANALQFKIDGDVEVRESEPAEPNQGAPTAYAVEFTHYDEDY